MNENWSLKLIFYKMLLSKRLSISGVWTKWEHSKPVYSNQNCYYALCIIGSNQTGFHLVAIKGLNVQVFFNET